MPVTGAESVLFVLGLVVAATGFVLVVFLVNLLLSPRTPNRRKNEPYECGMEPAGEPWSPWRLRFGTIAMLFVLFDAEAVLLFAVVSKLRGSPLALVEIGVFTLFLAFGLAYAWRKGALEWRM